jgi:hypothetical protein
MDPVTAFLLGYGAGVGTAPLKLLGQAALEITKPALTQLGEPLRKRIEHWQNSSFESFKRRVTTNADELFVRVGAILEARGVPEDARRQPPEELFANVLIQQHIAMGGDTIRTLFASLLAGSMDARSDGRLHPAIPDTLRQLDEAGARTLALLWQHYELNYEPDLTNTVARADGRTIERQRFSLVGATVVDRADRDALSLSVPHLERFGLVDLASWTTRVRLPSGALGPTVTHSIVELTEYGEVFCAACLGIRPPAPALPPGSTQSVTVRARGQGR